MASRPTIVLVFCVFLASAEAWEQCSPGIGGGICPDNNVCCPGGADDESSQCLTITATGDIDESHGSCCAAADDDKSSGTGCGPGYRCASSDMLHYCEKELLTFEGPEVLPRYRLCALPAETLRNVHALPVAPRSGDGEVATGRLAYLSTVGSVTHSDDGDSGDAVGRYRRESTKVALIVVHGSARNADDYLCTMMAAVDTWVGGGDGLEKDDIAVIAPRFLAPEDGEIDVLSGAADSSLPLLRWDIHHPIIHTWRYGADSVDADQPISSYRALDVLVETLVQDDVRFPKLEKIVVVGHSAGGQLAQRWVMLSSSWAFGDGSEWKQEERGSAVTTALGRRQKVVKESNDGHKLTRRTVPIRVVAANPRSFAYLDGRRYLPSTSSSFQATTFGPIEDSVDEIDLELRLPSPDHIESCPTYDNWEWGLSPGGNLPCPYREEALDTFNGDSRALAERYAARNVVYLNGDKDTLTLVGSCEDDGFQGPSRYVRSQRFYRALGEYFGGDVKESKGEDSMGATALLRHGRHVVEGVGHDHALVFQSPAGLRAVFGN